MRKVVFIGRWLNDKRAAGIHRVTLETLKKLDGIISTNEVELLIPPSDDGDYGFNRIRVVKIGIPLYRFGSIGQRVEGYLYKNFFAKLYIRKVKAVSADMLLQFPLFGCDLIAIYDCRVNMFPEFYEYSKEQRHIRKALLKHQNKAVKKCKVIVTDSFSAKRDIQNSYPELSKKIEVIYCAWQHFSSVSEDRSILDKLKIRDKEFFLSLGSRFPHKNAKWIYEASKKNPQYTFLISGKSVGDKSYENNSLNNLVFADRLSDAEVKALMRHCKAFIQPSLYEGFGIPPMEAMSVGANCMVSDIPVFREVYKDSVWYFDPTDYDNIDLDVIMSNPKESNDKVLNEYSWEKSAEELWEVLKELASEQ